ncbi:odorant receptor Or2-like [Andrena cerasifolii]|uniref:odorant receptor Or2-like n=1 Tax=Andrena cerasifolii TaxID=2819439 RepID=UPI0040377ED4
MVYLLSKYTIIAAATTAYLMYVRPLIKVLRGHQGYDNSTLSYDLPFRAHIIFDYTTDARIYSLLYLYQFPVTCVAVYHATLASFIVSLVLHFCGRLSVLSYRIRNISTESHRAFTDGIQKAVATHLELIESVQVLNDILSVVLLLELLSCCSRLGLAMFVVLVKLGTDFGAVINFSLYSIVQVGWLFLYCYIGEQAIFQSQKVGDAFYAIDWPAVENNDRKSLLICILNGYKTLYVTAGKVYTFSLSGFTSIIKTSMGCLSMLQASM